MAEAEKMKPRTDTQDRLKRIQPRFRIDPVAGNSYAILVDTVICAHNCCHAPIGVDWQLVELSGDYGKYDAIVCKGCAEELADGVWE